MWTARASILAATASTSLLLSGCRGVLGIEELTLDDAASTCAAPSVSCGAQCVDLEVAENHCGSCEHSCLGGDCIDGMCQPLLLAVGQAEPYSIAIDAINVYWINQRGAALRFVPIDGSSIPQQLTSIDPNPFGIALDEQFAYWATPEIGISRVALKKGATTDQLVTTTTTPHWLATDGTDVFWTDGQAAKVMKVDRNGAQPPVALASTPDRPLGIAVAAGYVYWANEIGSVAIQRLATDGSGEVENLASSASGGGKHLAVDATHVYYTTTKGQLMRVTVDASTDPEVLSSSLPHPLDLAIDGEHVYWTDPLAGTISRTTLAGDDKQTLVSDQSQPCYLAIDDDAVYWTNRAIDTNDGSVMKLAK